MIARIIAIMVMLVTLAHFGTQSAEAGVEPIIAADSFFTALNAGDEQAAAAAFSPDAIASLARGETYSGQADIAGLVQLMNHPGRHYEIVEASLADGTLSLRVEVSDHGIRWGEATIVAEAQGGKLHSYRETAFRLRLE